MIIVKGHRDDAKANIIALIKQFKLTSHQFRSLTIVSEQFVTKSIELGNLEEPAGHDFGALF